MRPRNKRPNRLFIITVMTVTAVGIAAGFLLTLVLLKEPICQGKYISCMRKWVHLLCPPEDLYTRIDKSLDISSTSNHTFLLSFKYVGPYSIEIFPRNLSDTMQTETYRTSLQANIDFYVNDQLVLRKDFKYHGALWEINRGAGIPQCEVDIPLELPIDQDITCVVNVTTPDPYLNNQSDVRLMIGKRSEL